MWERGSVTVRVGGGDTIGDSGDLLPGEAVVVPQDDHRPPLGVQPRQGIHLVGPERRRRWGLRSQAPLEGLPAVLVTATVDDAATQVGARVLAPSPSFEDLGERVLHVSSARASEPTIRKARRTIGFRSSANNVSKPAATAEASPDAVTPPTSGMRPMATLDITSLRGTRAPVRSSRFVESFDADGSRQRPPLTERSCVAGHEFARVSRSTRAMRSAMTASSSSAPRRRASAA